jgi:hypothetical protein
MSSSRSDTGCSVKPRVVYWNNIPAPYVVERFNALAARGTLDFQAWFNERREPDRSWNVDEESWQFRYRYIPSVRIGPRRLWLPLRELAAARPHLLVCGYDRASPALTSVFAHMFSDRVAFRTLPFYESWTPRTLWRQLALNVLFRLVDGAKVPGRAGREMAGSYGLPDARTWPVTQSIDVPRYSAAREFPAGEREAMRRRLGLRGTTIL